MEYVAATVQLQPNDVLFFFTDGLSEAMNDKEEEYSEARIRDFVVNCREKNPEVLISDIIRDVQAYDPSIPPQDDTTIIALKMTNGPRINEQEA